MLFLLLAFQRMLQLVMSLVCQTMCICPLHDNSMIKETDSRSTFAADFEYALLFLFHRSYRPAEHISTGYNFFQTIG